MKTILHLTRIRGFSSILLIILFFNAEKSEAQICTNPATIIYGLTGNGAIYPVDVTNASVGAVVKNTTYSGNSPNKSNGLAYNSTNGKFYYFKRNVGSSEEFVSYDPALGMVNMLASSTCSNDVHTGCITADGLYYYTIDVDANLNCYDIVNNTWTFISSSFTDQFGNDVASVIKSQSAGDIAFDGNGNLWIVTSNNSNYGVYSIPGSLPTTPVANMDVLRRVAPTAATPTGKSIAGIAFNPAGQIFMATKSDDRLYRLENNLSLTYLGTFSVSDIGNDLTSCAFPLGVLPITWLNFDVILSNESTVELSWQIAEKNNPGFTVQYSKDGKNWSDIAFIPIAYNDAEGQYYNYTHQSPSNGKNYYRIKTRNEVGKDSYSEIKVVMTKLTGKLFTIWPNPSYGSVNINGDISSPVKISIFDLAGRLKLEKQLLNSEETLNTSSLTPGFYILSFYTADGRKQTQKFIKQ